MALKIVLCNVKGLNSLSKCWIALKEFKSSGTDVVMVQELHFRPEGGGSFKFASKLFPTVFMASQRREGWSSHLDQTLLSYKNSHITSRPPQLVCSPGLCLLKHDLYFSQ